MIEHVGIILQSCMSAWDKTEIEWPNGVFQRVDGIPWVRMQYEFSIPTGRRVWVQDNSALGIVIASLFVPMKSGTRIANPWADDLLDLLSHWQENGLQCGAGTINDVDWSDPPGWFQRNIKVTFEYDQCLEVMV